MQESNTNHSRGHKVVALPPGPFDLMSYQDRQMGDDASASSYHSRLRSRSRGGSVSRSRDIVQDVYDRMGVNYVRGRPSIDTGLKDNDQMSKGQDVSPRRSKFGINATPGSHSDEASKGRISSQWPPATSSPDKSSHSRSFSVTGPKDRNGRRSMPFASSRSFSRTLGGDQRDEEVKTDVPDDERDAISIVSAKSSKSVRDRISLFGTSVRATNTGGSSRVNVRHSYGGSSNKRSHPPKINLYDSLNVGKEGVNDGADIAADPSLGVDQTSCIGGTRNRVSGANSTSHRSIGDRFLSSISKANSPSSSPRHMMIVKIPSNDGQGNEVASAASSVSGEDFMTSPTQRGGKFVKTNAGQIEKQIEERVNAQISILNRKFDAEIRRIENRIDQECKARIENLEQKNDELAVLLARAGIPI